MLEVVILTVIPELTQDEFDILLTLVSQEKQERIKRFHFFRDARNCLLGDVLTRVEICRATGLSNKQLEFSTNAYGKPFLLNSPHIHFNISHAGHYVVCAVSNEPVGIDIELINPSADMKIAERFFTPDETAYIMAGEQEQRFYKVWTKKESRIKWEGKGLHKPLTSFSVLDSNEQGQLIYHKVYQNDEAICHVCSTNKTTPSVKLIETITFTQGITCTDHK